MAKAYDEGTALLVVDVQNDFSDAHGSLAVPGGDEVVPVGNGEIASAEGSGSLVVFTQDWHPPSTPHFQKDGGIWPVHCVQGTWGADFHPDLRVAGEVIRKGSSGEDGYSGFTMRDPVTGETIPTPLEELLRDRGVGRLVVCGLATDYCVVETVIDARRLGYSVDVLADGIRAVELRPGDGDRAVRRMRDAGATVG